MFDALKENRVLRADIKEYREMDKKQIQTILDAVEMIEEQRKEIAELNKYISDLEDMVSTEELVAYRKWKEKHEGAE